MKPLQVGLARPRHRRQRHVEGAAPQRGGDRAPRRPADPHHVDRRARARAARASGTRGATGVNLTDDAAVVLAHPDIDIVVELIGGTRARAHVHPAGDRQRQARRHRQQGAARAARQRDLRRRAREGRDGRVRRRGRRRHSDHQGAARGPHRQPHRVDRRHHQRHVQLHPVRDARQGRVVRDGAGGSAGARLRRGRSDVRHRGHRRRAQAHDHVGDRVRRADAVRQGLHRRHLEAHAARTSATPRSWATGSSSSASRGARRRASSCACTRR